MFSLIFQDYEKVNSIARYIGFFFVALGVVSLFIQPEPYMLGFYTCLIIAVSSLIVAIYNDVRHKQYDRLKKRGLGALSVLLLTGAYFLILFFKIVLSRGCRIKNNCPAIPFFYSAHGAITCCICS
ncbi:hypothetical protein Asal01_02855 [Fodinibius salicampi]